MISHRIPDLDVWSNFVANHPQGNIFQTPEMYLIYKGTKNYYPIVVSNIEGGVLKGISLAVVQREISGFLGFFSSRSIIWGGPLVKRESSIPKMLDFYSKFIEKNALYTQIRNISDVPKTRKDFKLSGYNFEEHLNYTIDLEKGEEIIWKEMNKKRRNTIRKAINFGVTIESFTSSDDIVHSYSILSNLYKREKLPLADISLFKNAQKILGPKGMLKGFFAKLNGEIIGTLLLLKYNDRVYDWYSGSKFDYRSYCPNDLLIWHGIQYSLNSDFKLFDFGGAGKPGVPYGVRDFKKKFGGKEIIPGRYEKIHSPKLYLMVKALFNSWNKIR